MTSTSTTIAVTHGTPPGAASETLPTTMSAVVRHRYGPADTVGVSQAPLPVPGPHQVLVEVVAAGLDRGVWHLMTGKPYLLRLAGFGVIRPKQPVLGTDVAGRVVAVGSSVTQLAVGDDVMGIASGSFAEYAIADEAKLALKPEAISFDQAGASTISGITALQALTTVGRVEAGQNVLVIGASGGVGSFAVQIAASLGATVTGVASAANLDFVSSLGAGTVVDRATTDLADIDDRFDLIIDIAGRTPLFTLRRLLTERGTHVIVGGDNGGRFSGGTGRNVRAVLLSLFVRQRLTFFISSESRTYIDALVGMLASGEVVAAVDERVALSGAVDAIAAMHAGRTRGKTVITVGSATGR